MLTDRVIKVMEIWEMGRQGLDCPFARRRGEGAHWSWFWPCPVQPRSHPFTLNPWHSLSKRSQLREPPGLWIQIKGYASYVITVADVFLTPSSVPGILLRLRLCELQDAEFRPKVVHVSNNHCWCLWSHSYYAIISFTSHRCPTRQHLGLFWLLWW